MSLRRPLAAFLSAVALCAAPALAALALPASAAADAAGTPAGSGNVGGFLDAGASHACALQHDRVVRCWGQGSSGRLGSGGLGDRLAAPGTDASVLTPGTVAAITAGDTHSCALLTSGDVRCWGQGGSGQLGSRARDNRGDGTADAVTGTDDPSTVPLGGAAQAISAGSEFTCALMAGTGAVRCWGSGASGRLGSGDYDDRLNGVLEGPTDEASTVPLGAPATAISAGDQHACALLAGGVVRCWGAGANGRLGSGKTDDRLDGTADPSSGTDDASTVPLPAAATAISAGGAHTCALLATGDVACWGLGTSGQLGSGRTDSRLDGATANSAVTNGPTDAASIVPLKPTGTAAANLAKYAAVPNQPAVAISAGDFHTCAVMNTGDVRCWGEGASGQLGQGAVDRRLDTSYNAPADAAARVGGGPADTGPGLGATAIAVSAGWGSTCAELSNGTVRCWGNGGNGRLGTNATDTRLDGVVDPATGTDAASLVPVSALPLNAVDLTGDPAAGSDPAGGGASAPSGGAATTTAAKPKPSPAAKPSTATTVLSFSVRVKSRKAKIAALAVPTKAGTCPKKVTARALQGKTVLGHATLKVTKKGANCRAAGTLKLSRKTKARKALSIVIRGKGVKARTLATTA